MLLVEAIRELQKDVAAAKEALTVKENAVALLLNLQALHGDATEQDSPTQEPKLGNSIFPPAPLRSSIRDHSSEILSDRDKLIQAIRDVLVELGECDIHAADVHKRLEASGIHVPGKHPRQLVSSILDILVAAGTLKRIATGRGRMPNAYRLLSP